MVTTALEQAAPGHAVSKRAFSLHYLEMLIAMAVGMAVFGGIASGLLYLIHCSSWLDHAAFRASLMSFDMVLGMSAWMWYRGHTPHLIGEMDVVMVLPLAILIGPYFADAISAGALLLWMHLLMLPAMFAVMFWRRGEYAGHGAHALRRSIFAARRRHAGHA